MGEAPRICGDDILCVDSGIVLCDPGCWGRYEGVRAGGATEHDMRGRALSN